MRVHLIGSEGTGMKWLADYYAGRGCEVTGSDILTGGHKSENVRGADLVVYTAAADADNPELDEAARLNIKTISRAEALADAAKCFGKCIAVSGTHGKTTTVCMLTEILRNRCPASFFGGTVGGKRGSASGEFLIAEACEYKRGFLYMKPNIAVVLNAELDHTDCYASRKEVLNAFATFVALSVDAVVPDTLAGVLIPARMSVSVGRTGDYACIDYNADRVAALKTPEGVRRFRLGVPGKHNAENAVFAVAAARMFGAHYDEIAEGLERFRGADRRLQRVGSSGGVPVFSDYAHHPTELAASLAAYRLMGYGRVLMAFQPHTHERLGRFLSGFADVLAGTDSIILPVFRARGGESGACSETLARELRSRGSFGEALDVAEAAELIKKLAPAHDVIAVTGAGDNECLLPLILDQSSPNE